jgi:hypothetical protein
VQIVERKLRFLSNPMAQGPFIVGIAFKNAGQEDIKRPAQLIT